MNIRDSSRKLISFAMIIIMIIVSLSSLFLIATPAFADSWLSGWSYRKTLVIAHTGDGAQTNYQMKLLVGESSGSGTNNVNCNSHGLSSFNDLRFTTSDGSILCDYWIESRTGTTPNQVATVWIEIPSIAAHPTDTTIYMYYGNSSAAAYSSGVNTFIKFDDFERGADGDTVGGDWTEILSHNHISTDQKYGGTRAMKFVGDADNAQLVDLAVSSFSNVAVRFRYDKEDLGALTFDIYGGTNGVELYFETDEDVGSYNGSIYVDTTCNCVKDSWGLFEVNNFNWVAKTYTIVVDGATKTGLSCGWVTAAGPKIRFAGVGSVGVDFWIDDFLVRNFTVNEPTWSSYGGETSLIVESTVTTQSVSSIGVTAIIGNGTIVNTGGDNATRRGFCYMTGTTGDPTTANSVVYEDGTFGTGAFSLPITGLSSDTFYRVRAYAVNSVGTSYGSSVSVNTLTGIPSLTTQSCTDVITSSLIANGTITALNGADNVTSRGFCYFLGSSGDPTILDSIVHEEGGFSTGSFSLPITNLTVGSTYRIRAYGTTPYGTGYGTSISVNTLTSNPTMTTELPTNIASTSLTANGNIVSLGGVSATRRGFCFVAGGGEPTLSDNLVYEDGTFGVGAYSLSITNLTPGTVYRIRAYATTSYGSYYGSATSTGIPTLTTSSATSVLSTSFVANGSIQSLSGSPSNVTRRGFCYMTGESGDPTISNSVKYEEGSYGVGNYSLSVTNLSLGSYRVRSYAVTVYGTGYGNTVSVVISDIPPSLETSACSGISLVSATANGRIINVGNKSVTRRGFCYMIGVSGDPTVSNSVRYQDGSYGVGNYSLSLTGLSAGTSYRVRAYSSSSAGTGYGNTVTLTTSSGYSLLETNGCSGVTTSSAMMNGNVISLNGGENITRRGFCYLEGTSGTPTISNSVIYEDGSYGTGSYSLELTMSPGLIYRVRAYAVNAIGTSYGSTISTGVPELATTPAVVETVAETSATMEGEIVSIAGSGSESVTRRGFVYVEGSSGNPVIGESGTDVVYEDGDFEIGSFQLSISNLFPGRTYTVRPYAVTTYGVGYGMSVTVTTLGFSQTISRETQVTIIVNPMYIAIENSESSWMISTVSENSTYWWTSDNDTPSEPFEENQMKSIVTCVGSVAVDVFLQSHNFTGGVGWILSDNMTELNTVDNVIVLSVGASGYSEETMLVLTNDDSQSFVSNLSPDEFVKWCMRLKTGLFSDAEDKTGVVTLTAVAH